MMSEGNEQNSRPKKSPTLKTKKRTELKMGRLVLGSIGSTDAVIGGTLVATRVRQLTVASKIMIVGGKWPQKICA